MVDVGAGCGMRQGEVFGPAEDAIDVDGRTLHVIRQIKHVEGHPAFAQGGMVWRSNYASALLDRARTSRPSASTWGMPTRG